MRSIPPSDCFDVSASRRSGAAGRVPRRRLVPVLALALAATTAWAAFASYYLVFHDDALAGIVAQQRAQQIAYEERVGVLQVQAERSQAERTPGTDGLEGRLAALAERQALIEQRQGLLSGLGADALPAPTPAALPASAPIDQGTLPELRMRGGDRAEAPGLRLAGLETRLDRLSERQSQVLSGLATRASRNAGRFRSAIRRAGLDLSRFESGRFERPERGVGGPLVPVSADAFDLAFAQAQRSAQDERRLARTVAGLPFRRPLAEEAVYTSGFGTRLDPFTHGLALHTGIDLRADHGTAARATAPGRVTAAEYAGGYGNMVEIDHGHGIVTRYAHLASFAVAPGQQVAAGAIVGRVGSTGRSTGNHLHYETRIDGEPVDPLRFLQVGETLSADVPAAAAGPSGDGLLGEGWQAWTQRQMRALARR